MRLKQKKENIFVLGGEPGFMNTDAIRLLKKKAEASPLKRARICLHKGIDEPVHEMLIVLARGVYIRPHRHHGKTESFHLLEGRATAIFFDPRGKVVYRQRLSRSRGAAFLYRIRRPVFHTQIVESPFLVFYEVTRGPFRKQDTEFAPWAPPEDSGKAVRGFLAGLRKS